MEGMLEGFVLTCVLFVENAGHVDGEETIMDFADPTTRADNKAGYSIY